MDKVGFHPEAQAEYQEAIAWYQARSAASATRFEAEVERSVKLIEVNPGMFPRYDDDHRFLTLSKFPYSLVYESLPGQIVIWKRSNWSTSRGFSACERAEK